jgi:hypothetical protein
MNQSDSSTRAPLSLKAQARWRRDGITFLLDLSRVEAEKLLGSEQPGDLLNVCAGLSRFSNPVSRDSTEAGTLATAAENLAQDLRRDPKCLEKLIKQLREFLSTVAGGGVCTIQIMPGSKAVLHAGALKAGRSPSAWMNSPASRNGLIQAVLFGAFFLLSKGEGAMLRRCQREACKRVFLAKRPKQIFCDRPCASAAAFERYKDNLGADKYRAQHRKTARHSWRKTQKKQGRVVKQRIIDHEGVDRK